MRVDILETQLFCKYFSDVIDKSDLLPIKGVSTDSRDIKKGDLFLAIKGENFDGSEFVEEAFSSGATALKVTGAGGGGHLYVFAELAKHTRIIKELTKIGAQNVNFQYENTGATVFTLNNL